jgi:AraC family transcriptional regulator of adaptative response/methylated-DNA-[protein]-cysteine methyltransferase
MTLTPMRRQTLNSFITDDARWRAILRKDPTADGRFFYSVKTTGVFCRPSCPSRRPRCENVEFHLTSRDAQRAGFRPCKRCHPTRPSPDTHRAQSIETACKLIANSPETPDIATLAAAANLSSSHFHRTFKSLTGLTPKAYAAAHRSEHLRCNLKISRTVTSAIYNAGFNSAGPFYAASKRVLGMKPSTFRAGGRDTTIHFAIAECSLGTLLVAGSDIGICAIFLGDDRTKLVRELKDRFPAANVIPAKPEFETQIAQVIAFVERPQLGLSLPLDIRGTAFQQRVWQQLAKIPRGKTATYSQIALQLGSPRATRAVARACANNPIAVAIPCHRVIRADGSLSGYRWGLSRKQKLLDAERPS